MKSVFIVWYGHSRRAETLAAELGGHVRFFYETGLQGRLFMPLRYIMQGVKTWLFLERERPEVVLVQSPPILAPLVVALWCWWFRRRSGRSVPFVIDCHTGTFYSPEWRWTLPLLRLLSQRAAVTLVASEAALGILQSWRVKGLFLIDGLPVLSPPSGSIGSEGEARLAVISSFHDDEPVAEVFAAARALPHVVFYFSGNSKHMSASLAAEKPENVTFTNFLPDAMYTALLKNVHGLIVLTKEPNVLNCGAYEALVVEKPAIVSDWSQMRRYFKHGFIYVDNTPEAIAGGVIKLLNEQEALHAEIVAMRVEFQVQRQPQIEELIGVLGNG